MFGELTQLFSPLYQDTSGSQCFKFYYILYGDDVGSLFVYVYDIIAEETLGPFLEIGGKKHFPLLPRPQKSGSTQVLKYPLSVVRLVQIMTSFV